MLLVERPMILIMAAYLIGELLEGLFGYSNLNSYLRDNSDYDSKNAWNKCIEGANNSYKLNA